MTPYRKFTGILLLAVVIAGCGAGRSAGADVGGGLQSQDYGATKQMVIDILHSPAGRSAVAEMLQDPQLKQSVVVSEADIAKAVEKSLQSDKNQSFLSKQAKDPKFAEALAKAVQPELLQLQKQLMKDPEYQRSMLVLLKSPDFMTAISDFMKTPEFRGQIMKIMTDALQTPSFRMQFQDALKQAVKESIQAAGGKPSGEKSSDQGGGGGGSQSSGDGGEGGGGEGDGGGSGGGGEQGS